MKQNLTYYLLCIPEGGTGGIQPQGVVSLGFTALGRVFRLFGSGHFQ